MVDLVRWALMTSLYSATPMPTPMALRAAMLRLVEGNSRLQIAVLAHRWRIGTVGISIELGRSISGNLCGFLRYDLDNEVVLKF